MADPGHEGEGGRDSQHCQAEEDARCRLLHGKGDRGENRAGL